METQLGRQCGEALHARSLPAWLRKMVARLGARDGTADAFRPPPGPATFTPPPAAPDSPTPTHEELDALRCAIDGMTDSEIGLKLGLPERDVTLRLQCLMRKWGCRTRYEAGLKAIKLRLIEGI